MGKIKRLLRKLALHVVDFCMRRLTRAEGYGGFGFRDVAAMTIENRQLRALLTDVAQGRCSVRLLEPHDEITGRTIRKEDLS